MKVQVLGAIASLAIAAAAAPASQQSTSMEVKTVQLHSLLDALKSHGMNIDQDIEQLITCNISYSLALSVTGPPYTIALASLDLTNCAYTP
ncbi:hypothetical protein N7492_000692 [Penicillium capsulatum]|uniref:Uncharacterized protein n=1 Tax=Penicillium capsulatum TaxID=69766 RepID=A0A9W9IWD3_9EURO|nr:hypothetical protein N7492_000692 [Penicillium capsulatum]KAJ6130250.1 hypothetical protein N7512_003030 [Penicillium capsulatum]